MDFHSVGETLDTIDLFKRFPGKTRSRIEDRGSRIEDRGSRIEDQGSVQNESNKLNKLMGMSDGSST